MSKTVDFVFVGLVLAVATTTYVVKYGSEIEHNNIAKLGRDIETEKEAIDILRANWSLLTSPSRIQSLTKRHGDELQLDILQSHQVIGIDQIPLKPIQIPEDSSAMAEVGTKELSGIITGSIKSKGETQ
jgi:hypothetical protein